MQTYVIKSTNKDVYLAFFIMFAFSMGSYFLQLADDRLKAGIERMGHSPVYLSMLETMEKVPYGEKLAKLAKNPYDKVLSEEVLKEELRAIAVGDAGDWKWIDMRGRGMVVPSASAFAMAAYETEREYRSGAKGQFFRKWVSAGRRVTMIGSLISALVLLVVAGKHVRSLRVSIGPNGYSVDMESGYAGWWFAKRRSGTYAWLSGATFSAGPLSKRCGCGDLTLVFRDGMKSSEFKVNAAGDTLALRSLMSLVKTAKSDCRTAHRTDAASHA